MLFVSRVGRRGRLADELADRHTFPPRILRFLVLFLILIACFSEHCLAVLVAIAGAVQRYQAVPRYPGPAWRGSARPRTDSAAPPPLS